MSPLLLLLLGVSGVCCDSHTLRYYYTAVSDKGLDLPEFSVVGYVDDREFINYNSESKRARPVTAWMERNEGDQYWDGETQNFKGNEAVFRYNVRTVMSRFNQTAGIHIFQVMYGCELRDNNTEGSLQFGYDGREFMYLDTQRGEWIPTMPEAQISTQRWNSPEVRDGEIRKNYLQNICVDGLKRYIEYGKEDLERRVRPEVKVWGRKSEDGVTRLQCLAYGFHPRAVDVKWVRNGEDEVQSYEYSPVLPHPDGTYQKRVSVEVPTQEGDTYSCHVEHNSMKEILTVPWELNNGLPIGLIIGVITCLVVVAAIIGGVIVYKRKKTGYKSTSTADTNSDSSNPKA